ncbi:MarR family transcriptional regulator [Knoellia subterranea KCTC 19937]|uniref:MarR family transcriptional regulator n=1 Tax=Knoellia subterranea KCTC 19937 TaxID=1385521 RepID=A0A0A0JKZ7_9MICO|nr:MarR family transcriptional regulator [Knoellia subterranea KCTC 19937]
MPLLLLGGFRQLIDEMHRRLAERGHPDLRPAIGFAVQAISHGATTASDLGRATGVSKQAASKTVDQLLSMGYVETVPDERDARRKALRLTARGVDLVTLSGAVLDDLRAEWVAVAGESAVGTLETTLRLLAGREGVRTDTAGWLVAESG